MAYFKYFPQLEILNRTKNETSSDETHIVTNLFKRVKIREDILGAVSAFEDYKIDPGERPDSIAEAYYGCLLYTSPSPRDQRGSRMPSSA